MNPSEIDYLSSLNQDCLGIICRWVEDPVALSGANRALREKVSVICQNRLKFLRERLKESDITEEAEKQECVKMIFPILNSSKIPKNLTTHPLLQNIATYRLEDMKCVLEALSGLYHLKMLDTDCFMAIATHAYPAVTSRLLLILMKDDLLNEESFQEILDFLEPYKLVIVLEKLQEFFHLDRELLTFVYETVDQMAQIITKLEFFDVATEENMNLILNARNLDQALGRVEYWDRHHLSYMAVCKQLKFLGISTHLNHVEVLWGIIMSRKAAAINSCMSFVNLWTKENVFQIITHAQPLELCAHLIEQADQNLLNQESFEKALPLSF
jgi:hypothetical protein